jgi:Lamin Tail Domain
MRNYLAAIIFVSGAVALSASPGCGDDTSSTTNGTTTSGTSTTTTTGPGTGTGGTGGATTGTGGTGGAGGAGGGVGGGGGAGGMGNGGAGGGSSGDHLVISELGVAPVAAEFVEIYNPTGAPVDLTNYYLSDNSTYFGIAAGMPWDPITNNMGTDFLVQFPPGAVLAPDAAVVIAAKPGFEQAFNDCPDYILSDVVLPCAVGEAAAMVVPANGGLDEGPVGFSDSREMVVLFRWDGTPGSLVQDVDYLTWGPTFEAGTRADKTGVGAYLADTSPDLQKPALEPPPLQSIERCVVEGAETASGGNGISGHDETSEDLGAAFLIQITPSPGVKNSCL